MTLPDAQFPDGSSESVRAAPTPGDRPTSDGFSSFALSLSFWLAYWLAVGLIVIKLFYFGLPSAALPGWVGNYFRSLAIATANDNLFVLVLGLITAVSFALLPRQARWRKWAAGVWTTIYAALLLYAIVNAYVFALTQCPLSRTLIAAAGSWADIRSSVASTMCDTTITALTAGPLAFVLLVYASHRFIGMPKAPVGRATAALLAGAVVGQFAYARSVQSVWTRRNDHRIASNAHWTLASSYLRHWDDTRFDLPAEGPAELEDEFRPLRERGPVHSPRWPQSSGLASAVDVGSAEADLSKDAETARAIAHNAARPFREDLPRDRRPRHVVLYVLESTSAQFLHLYGSEFLTTPNLDAEAAHAMVLTNFYSHIGMTPRALVALTSSNYARAAWQANPNGPGHRLNQPGTLLSQTLKSRGFRTLALTSASFEFSDQRAYLENRGFDAVVDMNDLPGKTVSTWGKADDVLIDRLLRWIDDDPGYATPFFALCWTNLTHHPYNLPEGMWPKDLMRGRTFPAPALNEKINAYLNCLKEADRQLGRLFAALRQRGLADDTLVVLVGDHGEAFEYPHDYQIHGFRIYEEDVHVPCILWNPRLFSPGMKNAAVAAQIDIAPTIADLLGIEPAGTWQGYSLFDPARPGRAYFSGELNDYLFGVREGDWKYIYNASTGFDELYNLRRDPDELSEIGDKNPLLRQSLRQHMLAWVWRQQRHGAGIRP